MNEATKELILKYFDAFASFYGILPMKRAWRIIKQQNPDIEATDLDFIDFFESCDLEKKPYIIVYDEDMYSNALIKDKDAMQKILIAEYLYIFDEENYDEIKQTQTGLRYYVPDKDELLRYSDELYTERNKYSDIMIDFLCNKLKFDNDTADEIVDQFISLWTILTKYDDSMEMVKDAVKIIRSISEEKASRFEEIDTTYEFIDIYVDMYNNTRLPMLRGLTPIEANCPINCGL